MINIKLKNFFKKYKKIQFINKINEWRIYSLPKTIRVTKKHPIYN